jgi:hypothetical protein
MRLLFVPALLGGLVLASGGARAEDPGTTAFASLGPVVIHGNEADSLMVGAGLFDLRHEPAPSGTVEYRFGRKVFVVGLTLGVVANARGGLYGYVGAYTDLSYDRFYLTPQLAMGGYHHGDSSNLGGVFQFRQSIDLGYRFDNGHRLGLRAAHISNADIHEHNPGEEEILLTYSIVLGPYL